MSSPAKHYQKSIHKKIQRLATWEPGDVVAVGEIGVLRKGAFKRVTSLDELRIPFEVEPGETKDYRSLTSTSGVALHAEAGGKAARGLARVVASLHETGTFVFEAAGVSQERMGGSLEVIRRLRELRDGDDWDRRWVLIDQVWRVERGTVIIATGGASEVGLTIRADVEPSLRALVDIEADAAFDVRGQDVYKLLGAQNFTPLYTAWTFNLWGRIKHLGLERDTVGDDGPPPVLGIDELLDSWEDQSET